MDTMPRTEHAAGIAALKERIARIQTELAEISAALDALNQPTQQPAEPAGTNAGPESRVKFVDKASALRAFDEMLQQMGIADVEPIGAEALQQMLLEEGVNPNDNLLSRGIIEMREE